MIRASSEQGKTSDRQPIPWAKPEFWGKEKDYVGEALASTWISGGPFVDRLESEFGAYMGSAHAVATSNGTAALHLAYLALGIRPDDEIIVPGFAFMAAANIALHVGAVPVFADVDRHSWCIAAQDIERRLSPRTRAIVPVHTYGNVCAMDEIMALAAHHGLPVVEDAAEAFASRYRGKAAGAIGSIGTFSLHATKTITTGEGGMVLTGDDAMHERMLLYRSHGMGPVRYRHEVAGHNFRLTNLQAAIGCAQLEQVDRIIAERKRVFATYQEFLGDMPGAVMQHFSPEVDAVPWVVAIKLDPNAFPQGRDNLMQQMTLAGVETRPGFYTPASMPHLYSAGALPVADEVSNWVIALPSFPTLSDQQIEYICSQVKRARK